MTRCSTVGARTVRKEAPLLRVWINRSYATTAHAIADLHRDPPAGGVHVLGTHVDPQSPVLAFCDATEAEPDVEGAAYVEWALDLCRRHAVDVVVPRAHAATLAEARVAFARIGAAVLAAAPETIALLDDKARAYEAAAEAGLLVPPHRVVRSGAQLLVAVQEIAALDGTACIKPVSAAGASGFRILNATPSSLADLLGAPQPILHPDVAAAALDSSGAPPFLVMPVLPGPEVSVDCLADGNGVMRESLARTKGPRDVMLDDVPEVQAAAAVIVERHRLAYLSNTQFRWWRQPGVDDVPRPYLLETNPRAAAGMYQGRFAGLHLLRDAIELAVGLPAVPRRPRLPVRLAILPDGFPLS